MSEPSFQSAVEFHDSEVSQVVRHGEDLLVRFSAAYVHRSAGKPGVDSGEGFVQAVELRLSQATAQSSLDALVGKLSDGAAYLRVGRVGLISLPYLEEGPVKLELAFANGESLTATATAISLSSAGPARFVESFRC